MRPLEPVLAGHRIDTLVIVPDGVLRLIPFAALYDGEHFVVERYATAIAPSLHLVDPKPLTAAVRKALALGCLESCARSRRCGTSKAAKAIRSSRKQPEQAWRRRNV